MLRLPAQLKHSPMKDGFRAEADLEGRTYAFATSADHADVVKQQLLL